MVGCQHIKKVGLSNHPVLGHAGALRQARQLGKELYIGLHSDEEILDNKGPTVMTLDERCVPSTDHPLAHPS